MAKPSKLPSWDTTEVNSTEPDSTHQDEGWLAPGGIPEKPPFQTFNHWMNAVWKWLKEFNKQGIVEWDGITIYGIDDITKGSDGFLYQSLQAANTNKNPISEPTWWEPLVQKTNTENLILNPYKDIDQRVSGGGGKIQVIEADKILGGNHVLGFTGTATATIYEFPALLADYATTIADAGTNTLASGVASGEVVVPTTGYYIAIEYNTTDFDNVTFNQGAKVVDLGIRHNELELCKPFYNQSLVQGAFSYGVNGTGLAHALNANWIRGKIFDTPMRIAPIFTNYGGTGTAGQVLTAGAANVAAVLVCQVDGSINELATFTQYETVQFTWTANAEMFGSTATYKEDRWFI